jgi:hypothetical protein
VEECFGKHGDKFKHQSYQKKKKKKKRERERFTEKITNKKKLLLGPSLHNLEDRGKPISQKHRIRLPLFLGACPFIIVSTD